MVPDLSAMPFTYFSTAAGPDSSDLFGPPGSILDTYGDGTPLAVDEAAISGAGVGGAAPTPFFLRADVVGLVAAVVGGFLVYKYLEAE